MDQDQEGGGVKRDYSTAILEPKTRKPNCLLVDDAEGGVAVNSSTVALSVETMATLNIFPGDPVKLRGQRRRETVCYAKQDESCPVGMARLNRVVRGNLRVHLADTVTINPCGNIKHATKVSYSPFEDTIEGITGNLFETYVMQFVVKLSHPVGEDDVLAA